MLLLLGGAAGTADVIIIVITTTVTATHILTTITTTTVLRARCGATAATADAGIRMIHVCSLPHMSHSKRNANTTED